MIETPTGIFIEGVISENNVHHTSFLWFFSTYRLALQEKLIKTISQHSVQFVYPAVYDEDLKCSVPDTNHKYRVPWCKYFGVEERSIGEWHAYVASLPKRDLGGPEVMRRFFNPTKEEETQMRFEEMSEIPLDWNEFKRLTGIEISYEDWENLIKPEYTESTMNKRGFCQSWLRNKGINKILKAHEEERIQQENQIVQLEFTVANLRQTARDNSEVYSVNTERLRARVSTLTSEKKALMRDVEQLRGIMVGHNSTLRMQEEIIKKLSRDIIGMSLLLEASIIAHMEPDEKED